MDVVSLGDLLEVQALDLEIDRLLDRRQSLPELDAYKTAHDRLTELEGRRVEAEQALRQLELDLDKAEGELELLELKLDEHETRLFAGGMSARETEHMRLEVQSLRGQKGTLEERALGLMENVDPARAAVEELAREMEEVAAGKTSLEASIKDQWKEIDAELARKEEKKREAVVPIPADLMELYEDLRRLKEGVAVAAFDHGVCGGCHMALSPAERDEVFSSDLPRCSHCRRLLVA